MNRGDEHPINDVMPVTCSSACNTLRSESATMRVSFKPLPSGRNTSTANWLRSAKGKRRTLRAGTMSSDSVTMAKPPPMVSHGRLNVKLSTRS